MFILGVLFLAAGMAYVATAPELRPGLTFLGYVLIFMTARSAMSLSAIAVMVVGYWFSTGELAARSALSIVAGLAVFLGSAQVQVLAALIGLPGLPGLA
jgi:hypothetical protein